VPGLVKPSLVFGVHALAMAAGTGHHVEDLPGGGSHARKASRVAVSRDGTRIMGSPGVGSGHAMSCRSAGREWSGATWGARARLCQSGRNWAQARRAGLSSSPRPYTGPYPRDVPVMCRSRKLPVSVRPESPLGRALTGRTSKLRIFPPFRNNALYFMAVWVGRAGVRAADGCRGPGGFRLVAVSRGGMGAICDL
jgi:hypothetical protein